MTTKINWGILGTADIAIEQVIPAMMNCEHSRVHAISSRSYDKAKKVADRFSIEKCFGTYEEMLNDEEVEAIYIPLPNHLHVPWSIKALRAGKHVLVEKPIGLSRAEAESLMEESNKHPHLKIMEGFMYRHHPQWIKAKELVESGEIGDVKSIQSSFSFFDDNANSIVNRKEYGGGSLMDIGCYPISLSRFIFDSEPEQVLGTIEYHPEFDVDSVATAILKFNGGTSSFFSSIQLQEHQQARIFGTNGEIEFEIPFNPIANKPSKIFLHRNDKREEIVFDSCDQYTIQADLFSLAILNDTEVPTSLLDAANNMRIIERIIESDKLGEWR